MRHDAAVQAIELVARATVDVTTRALAEATPALDLSLLQWRALLIVGAASGVRSSSSGPPRPAPASVRSETGSACRFRPPVASSNACSGGAWSMSNGIPTTVAPCACD